MASGVASITIRGDVSQALAALDQLGFKAESTAGVVEKSGSRMAAVGANIASGFGRSLGVLSSSGILGPLTETFQNLQGTFQGLADKADTVAGKVSAIGAAGVGAGALLMGAAAGDQQAHQQLAQAVSNTGASIDDYQGQIDKAVDKQATFGNTASQTQNALQSLVQATGSTPKALGLMSEASDLAAAKHESLQSAAEQLSMMLSGKGARTLSQFGLSMDKSIKDPSARGQKAVEELAGKIHGQAAAASDTWTGKLKELRAEIENHVAEFGQKWGPTITAAGAAMTVLGGTMQTARTVMDLFRGSTEATAAATEVLSGAEDSAAVSEGLALGPILLVVGGLAVLGLAAYELATHWSEVWGEIKKLADDAYKFLDGVWHDIDKDARAVWGAIEDFFKQWWPEILGVFTGGIGLVVGLIIQHWSDISKFTSDLWHDVTGFFENIWKDATHWVSQLGTDLVTFFTNLPGQLASVGAHMWDWVLNGLKTVADDVANLWNDSIGSLSFKIPSWVPGIGGDGFSMPKIPVADTGGIVTGPTLAALAMNHVPEMIVPLSQASQYGFGAPNPGPQGGTVNNQVIVNAVTGADAYDIGNEASWALQRMVA